MTIRSIVQSKPDGLVKKSTKQKAITAPQLQRRKDHSTKKTTKKITALTAYDFTTARLLDEAGIDLILVGDSLANTFQGQENTLPVTLDEMIYHTRCVRRGVNRALLVADMPFMSYQVSVEQALLSAGRLIKEGLAAAVKLEGGLAVADQIRAIATAGIPVVGHVGLTPQSFHKMGGHRIQGRESASSSSQAVAAPEQVLQDALSVAEAGAFAVVLEGIPSELAAQITATLNIPTIGIGAGVGCDGQILVVSDLLGLDEDFCPSFVKRYASLAKVVKEAVSAYISDVKQEVFPGREHSFFEEITETSKNSKKRA